MYRKENVKRDPFKISLGGIGAVSGYASVPAISYERLRKNGDDRPDDAKAGRSARRWFLSFRTSM